MGSSSTSKWIGVGAGIDQAIPGEVTGLFDRDAVLAGRQLDAAGGDVAERADVLFVDGDDRVAGGLGARARGSGAP